MSNVNATIIFDNAGQVTLQLNDKSWCHTFAVAFEAVLTYTEWLKNGMDSSDFEGHDTDAMFSLTEYDYTSGAYSEYSAEDLKKPEILSKLRNSSSWNEMEFGRSLTQFLNS